MQTSMDWRGLTICIGLIERVSSGELLLASSYFQICLVEVKLVHGWYKQADRQTGSWTESKDLICKALEHVIENWELVSEKVRGCTVRQQLLKKGRRGKDCFQRARVSVNLDLGAGGAKNVVVIEVVVVVVVVIVATERLLLYSYLRTVRHEAIALP